MAQTIQIKRNNSNAATVPSSLLVGELAVNLLDRTLFSSDGTTVVKLYTGTDKWFNTSGAANKAVKVGNALTFGSKTYDGSAAKTIVASDLGALTAHQTIYALTINNSAGTAQVTYTPNSKAASLTLTKAMVGLGNVENTALSTWAGSSKITTLGTITSGTWNGTKIANAYLANSAITINGTSTSLGGSFNTASITAGTAGTSSATSGYTLSVPYVTMNKYGIITGYGTHTHTINSIPNSSLANSSVTISGTAVSLGGSITQAALRTALGLGSNAYTSTAYLPLSGGTLTSSNVPLSINRTGGNSVILYLADSTQIGVLGFDASGNCIVRPNYQSNSTYYSVIHSGNIGSYNAGSATKLQTARTIWGQSFDGTGNVSGALSNADSVSSYDSNTGYYIGLRNRGLSVTDGGALIYSYGNTPISLYTNAIERMRILGNGNILIGTTTDSGYKLQILSDAFNVAQIKRNISATGYGATILFSTLSRDLGMIGWNQEGEFNVREGTNKIIQGGINSGITVNTNFIATGEVTSGSDARYKHILSHAELDIKTIANAPIINFKWTDREDSKVHLGSTAQYWYGTAFRNGVTPTEDEKLWTMGYGQIALASVVSVAKRVVNHEEEIKNLKKRVNDLETELKQYRNGI